MFYFKIWIWIALSVVRSSLQRQKAAGTVCIFCFFLNHGNWSQLAGKVTFRFDIWWMTLLKFDDLCLFAHCDILTSLRSIFWMMCVILKRYYNTYSILLTSSVLLCVLFFIWWKRSSSPVNIYNTRRAVHAFMLDDRFLCAGDCTPYSWHRNTAPLAAQKS